MGRFSLARVFRPFPLLLAAGLLLPLSAAAQVDLLREAARLDAEGKCAGAEVLYQNALAQGTPSPALLNNAGNHYLTCGPAERARTFFERLVEYNPAHPNANLQLARLAVDEREGEKALGYLSRVNDPSPAVRLLRAEASHWAGRHREALTMLESLQKEARGDQALLFPVGVTCGRLGLYEQAEAVFSTIVASHPDNFDALFLLGRAAARAQHQDRALRALEVALKLRPEDVNALFELGLVHAGRQDFSRAVYVLAQARQRAPKRPDILLALARAAEDAGYYGDSALAYDEYLQLQPGDDRVRRDRARVYGLTGERLQEGLAELARYVEKHPDDPAGFFYQAQLSWQLDPQQALRQLSEAIRRKPDYTAALHARAWLLTRLGNTDEALRNLETAAKAGPNAPRVLDQLGVAYLTADRAEDAEKILRRALTISPRDADIHLHLGSALMALGRGEEAQPFIEEFRKLRPSAIAAPRKNPGMIEAATMSAGELAKREIERLVRDARSHPDQPDLQLHLAELLLASGRADEAKREFAVLLDRNASRATWEKAGASLLRNEQYELAIRFLERAAPESAAARLDLAIARWHTDGPEQALKTIEDTPGGELAGDYLVTRAGILDAAGRGEEAEKVLQQGLLHTMFQPHVARQAVVLLLRRDRRAEALKLLEQAVQRAPDDPDLLLLQAGALALNGDAAAAGISLKQIQLRWPEWDRPYLADGLLLESLGEKTEALKKLRTALALGSQDTAVQCSLARLSESLAPDTRCDCARGLREWIVESCNVR